MSAEHIENVMEHDDSQTQSETHSTPSYSATRRTARKHKRVVRQGTELFDADGVKLEPSTCSPSANARRMTTSAS